MSVTFGGSDIIHWQTVMVDKWKSLKLVQQKM